MEATPPHEPQKSQLRLILDRLGQVAAAVLPVPFDNRGNPTNHEDIPLDLESQQGVSKVTVSRKVPKKFPPVFMLSISLIQVVLFYAGGQYFWLNLSYDPYRRHELWRYFTMMLVHSTASHLWGNVVFQLILGCLLEIVHHWKRISILYMSGVLGGSLAITVLDPNSYGVGASAGVYALLAAHLATIIMNWKGINNKGCRIFWLVLFVCFDIGISVLSPDPYTSHAGHLGGAVTGFIVTVLVLRNFDELSWEKKFQKVLAVTLGGLFVLVVLVNVFWSSHYRESVYSTDYMDTYSHYVIEQIHYSASDSVLRTDCLANEGCAHRLREYSEKVNATLQLDRALLNSSTAATTSSTAAPVRVVDYGPPPIDYDSNSDSIPGS